MRSSDPEPDARAIAIRDAFYAPHQLEDGGRFYARCPDCSQTISAATLEGLDDPEEAPCGCA